MQDEAQKLEHSGCSLPDPAPRASGRSIQYRRRAICAQASGGDGAGYQFVRSFLDAAVLNMTFTRHFGEPIRATFPVHGAREALKEVGRQCGWMRKK